MRCERLWSTTGRTVATRLTAGLLPGSIGKSFFRVTEDGSEIRSVDLQGWNAADEEYWGVVALQLLIRIDVFEEQSVDDRETTESDLPRKVYAKRPPRAELQTA